jgi:hypothetical protein
VKYNDGNRQGDQVLLVRQVSVHCDEHTELRCGEGQQFSIFNGGPPHLTRGLDIMTDDNRAPSANRRIRPAGPSRGRYHSVLRFFKEGDDFLARHRGETLEKIIDRFTSLKVIEQGLDRNSGPVEDGEAAHYVRAA